MKISTKVDIEICQWSISIAYKFSYLRCQNFKPKRVVPIPKLISDKYFSLINYPKMIAFSDISLSTSFVIHPHILKDC